jgi:hypothetical protein
VSQLALHATGCRRPQRSRIAFAVIRRAASQHRKEMTSATSSGLAMWIMSSAAATAFETAGVTHPVSVTGGCTTFAVMPRSASS